MQHTISINAAMFAKTLKDATAYASKDNNIVEEATGQIILSILPKNIKLAVIACDGKGYYESRLALVFEKGNPKPSLPGKEQRLCVAAQDALMLAKFISTRTVGCITLDIDDDSAKDNRLQVKMTLPDGSATSFFSRTDIAVPDYASITRQAEKGKKNAPELSNVFIPVHEMARAGKVLPQKEQQAARIYTARAKNRGSMALLEYISPENDTDIRIIFMLSELSEAA